MALDYDVFTSPTNELDALLRSADVLNVSADTTESSVISNSISSGLNLGNAVSGEELGAIICYAKSWFNDPVEGWMQGYDPSDAKYKWIIGSNVSSIDWGVSAAGTLTINGAGLVSPTLSYGKTSFSDSTHAGYWISDAGIYVGAAADASKLKYTVADGTFDFVGTISSRSTVTVASAINSSGNLVTDIINARIDSNAKTILAGFDFGTANYAGAVKTGDIAWNVTTGAITGGSGVVVYRNGIVGAAAGVTTFSIDATTGNATFAGSLSAPSGTIGGFTIGATALTATNLAITSGAANVANISVGTGSNLAGMNSGNAASDIAFWAGSTFANRATAPFRVDLSGQVTIQYGADYEADAAFYVLDNRNVANVPALDIVSVNGSCLSAASSANSEVVLITSTGFTGGTGSGILNVIGSENATGPAIRGEAKGESVIELKQRTAVSTNYYRTDRLIGDTSVNVSRFIANNVSPDGVLTGTKGSICQSSNGKFYVNTDGATAWAELASGGSGEVVPVNAGQDISAGDCVAIEAGGLFRTRATKLASAVAGSTTAGDSHYLSSRYFRRRYLSMSSTVKMTFSNGYSDSYKGLLVRFVVNPSAGSVISAASAAVSDADINEVQSMDMVKLTETTAMLVYVVCITATSAYKMRCKIVTTDSSIVQNAAATSLETVLYSTTKLSVERVSDTEAVVFFTDGTDLKAQQITVSGTTCTFATVSTIRASAVYPESVCRFGTTNKYCFIGSDASPAASFAICGTYSSGSFSMGNKTTITTYFTAGEACQTVSADDSTIVMANISGVNLFTYARTITVSGTDVTLNAAVSMWNYAGGSRKGVCVNRLSDNTFSVSSAYYVGGVVNYGAQLLSLENGTLAALGSILSIDDTGDPFGIVGPGEFCAGRLLVIKMVYTAGAYYWIDAPISLTTNHSNVIGLAAEDIASGAQGKIVLNGLNQEVSGLTALTSYYTYLDGQTTSTLTYGATKVGMALSATCLNVKIN
jgi:hypothetical protein